MIVVVKRAMMVGGLLSVGVLLAACTPSPEASPATVAVVTTTTTTEPTPPPTTVPPTTAAPTSTLPPKPVVTAVPLAMPIAVRPETTAPPAPGPIQEPPQSTSDSGGNYVGSGSNTPIRMGWMEIPKVGMRQELFTAGDQNSQASVNNSLNYGPSIWASSALPGAPGNLVVAGHRTSHTAPFRHLDQLSNGDEIVVAGPDGVAHTYLVTQVWITHPDDLTILNRRGEGATLTLFACHPPGSIRQRIIVFADLRV